MLTKKKLTISILFVLGIVLLVNIIGDKISFRLDFTADQRYSLSNATNDILDELVEPVTVTAYFSENLPPNIAQVKNDFKDLLIEYANRSDGMVVYEFINPNEDQKSEMEAQQSGIRPVMINVRERDQMKQQRAYLGAIVQMGEKKEVIPFIKPGAAMEYELSSNIKKIAIADKPVLGLMQGFGIPKESSLQQLEALLDVTHKIRTFELSDTAGVPSDINTVAVIAPKDSIPTNYFSYLDEFLGRGGKLILALNTVEGNLQNAQGEAVNTGFAKWLKNYKINVDQNFVMDIKCNSIMVRQQQGPFSFNTPVSFPYLPIVSNFAEHPASAGLESVMFQFVSSIDYSGLDSNITATPLAFTSEKAAKKTLPLYFDVMKDWKASDFPESNVPVAVAFEGALAGNASSKLVVIGDGDFVVGAQSQQGQQVNPDNINFMVNSIDWLSDDTGLNELRTKGITSRPLNAELEDGTKALIKYANFLAPILIILLYGIFRFQVRRKFRNQLANINYE